MTFIHSKVWKWPSDLPVYRWQIVLALQQKFVSAPSGIQRWHNQLPFNLGVVMWLQVSQWGASKVTQAISRIFSEILSIVKCRWQWGLREWWAKKWEEPGSMNYHVEERYPPIKTCSVRNKHPCVWAVIHFGLCSYISQLELIYQLMVD